VTGSILTDRQRELQRQRAAREGVSLEDAIAAAGHGIPMGRVGQPEELGSLVGFLAPARASDITGQTIAVDGGAVRGLL
jgi:3-oxoacyl-[acyl-carrier protein] reductase